MLAMLVAMSGCPLFRSCNSGRNWLADKTDKKYTMYASLKQYTAAEPIDRSMHESRLSCPHIYPPGNLFFSF
jgi:hypothetical protein